MQTRDRNTLASTHRQEVGKIAYIRLRQIALRIPGLSGYTMDAKKQQKSLQSYTSAETIMSKIKAIRQERKRKKRQRNILIAVLAGGLLLITSGIFIAINMRENRADPSLIEVSGQPSLKVDQELIDYGDVKLNTNLTFELQLTNIGDQPLRISETPYIEVLEGC